MNISVCKWGQRGERKREREREREVGKERWGEKGGNEMRCAADMLCSKSNRGMTPYMAIRSEAEGDNTTECCQTLSVLSIILSSLLSLSLSLSLILLSITLSRFLPLLLFLVSFTLHLSSRPLDCRFLSPSRWLKISLLHESRFLPHIACGKELPGWFYCIQKLVQQPLKRSFFYYNDLTHEYIRTECVNFLNLPISKSANSVTIQ